MKPCYKRLAAMPREVVLVGMCVLCCVAGLCCQRPPNEKTRAGNVNQIDEALSPSKPMGETSHDLEDGKHSQAVGHNSDDLEHGKNPQAAPGQCTR